MRTALKALAVIAGLGLFAAFVSRADWRAVGELLSRLGWIAPLLLVPYLVVYGVDCLGWRCCLPTGLNVSFPRLFRIRWTGESVNNVLPSAYVGGEAVKIYFLRRHGLAPTLGASSAVVSKTAQSVAQLVFILGAALVFAQIAGDQPGLRAGMVAVLTCGGLILAALFWMQRRGLFASLLAVAPSLGVKASWLDARRAPMLEADRAIGDFYREHRPRFYASSGFYLAGWFLDTTEIYLFAHLLGMPITWAQALVVEAFTGVAKVLGMWVPGSLGVQESSIVLLGRLAGLPDALALAYALLRRAREVLFALAGWLFLWAEHATLRSIRAETAQAAGAHGAG